MRLAFDRRGRGPGLLLIHAGIADRRMWKPQLDAHADRFDMVAPDLPGFGGSPAPDESVSVGALLAALLDDLGLDSVDVAGCSMGGSMALDFAIEHPDRVRRLVLVGAAIGGKPLGAQDAALFADVDAAESAGDVDALNEAEIRLWVDGPGRPAGAAPEPVRRLALEMNGDSLRKPEWDWKLLRPLEPPAAERLGEVRAPTLVLVGEHDLPHCHAAGRILASEIRGARLEVMPETAHLPSLERPDLFDPLLVDFLRD